MEKQNDHKNTDKRSELKHKAVITNFDLLNLVEQGGCSAKIPARELQSALADLRKISNPNVLIDIETHDDAGIYKIRDDYALVQTTDFFPPVCSDPYDFGQISAANALSDVYAMGGEVLSALNIILFPAQLPLHILREILAGAQDKVVEAGGVIIGGHTIANNIPVCGLAVTGWVHPGKIITNSGAKPGDLLVLTKQVGTGVIISAKKNELADENTYQAAIKTMKHLNKSGADVMKAYSIKGATDITGFGILGHGLKMAQASNVSLKIHAGKVPVMNQVLDLIEMGCIPGAAFRNLEFAESECSFDPDVDYNHKMLLCDAQTSGGILMCVPEVKAEKVMGQLKDSGYPYAEIIGEVVQKSGKFIYTEK